MNRYKAIVSYDGSAYYGWQSQKNQITIQKTINDALDIINKRPVKMIGSGRTDGKVHAYGQVFHFDSALALTGDQWIKALNGHLPKDIRIISVVPVASAFHARYDAIGKRYDYYINVGPYDLFARNYVWQYNRPLAVEKMRETAPVFIGEHDFSSFCANSFTETPDQVRTIGKLDIMTEASHIHFVFVGNGFMRYMVRMIVGTLVEVGKGKLDKTAVERMLAAADKQVCHFKAPPEGLYLMEVYYPDKGNFLD